jgi:diacylglycerol kinase (ATP)
MNGLKWAFNNELSFRLDVFIFLPFFFIAVKLGGNYLETVVLVTPIFLILICELINTSIEALCNQVSREYSILIKISKDIASAAVFLSIVFFLFIWVSFFVIYRPTE